MCCRKLSEFLTLKKCCCGIPLKAATYIAGSFVLIFCSFTVIESIQDLCSPAFYDRTYVDHGLQHNLTPAIAAGSGVGLVDYALRNQDGFEMSTDYVHIMLRGLLIGWCVINGFFMVSTCVMLYGNAKGMAILLLQWLVISATIAIGNILDIIFAILYMTSETGFVYYYYFWFGSVIHLVQCLIESGGIIFAFVVVRSHYYHLTLPSIPLSFKTLERREETNEEEETESMIQTV